MGTEHAAITGRPENVQDMTGLGRTTVYRLIREGKIRSVKVGRARLIDLASVREFLAAGDSRGQ